MRDLKLYYNEGFDIDVSATGDPVYVDTEGETQDQRAAVATAIIQGSIPGAPTVGVDWSALYKAGSEGQNVLTIYNNAQQMIAMCAGSETVPTAQYMPLLTKDEDTQMIKIKTVKSGGSST